MQILIPRLATVIAKSPRTNGIGVGAELVWRLVGEFVGLPVGFDVGILVGTLLIGNFVGFLVWGFLVGLKVGVVASNFLGSEATASTNSPVADVSMLATLECGDASPICLLLNRVATPSCMLE